MQEPQLNLPSQSILGSVMEAIARRPAWLRGLLLALFCFLLTLILLARTSVFSPDKPNWSMPWDHHKYIYMAQHPVGSFHISPTAQRIAVPFLIGKFPLPTLTGFKVVTFASIVCTGFLFYYVLHAAGYSAIESFLGVVMFFSYGAATKLLLSSPYQPDAASFALGAAALYFLFRDHDVLLALTLALGVSVKETVVLFIPLIYTLRAQRQRILDVRLIIRTVLIGLPALVVLFSIQKWVPSYNDVPSYVAQMGPQLTEVHLGTATFTFMDALRRVTPLRLHDSPINILRDLTFGNVGILWLLPFFGLRSNQHGSVAGGVSRESTGMLLLRFLPFLALTYFGWFMSLNTNRRFAIAFPIWIMMSLNGIRSLGGGWGIDISWFVPVFLVQFALNLLQPLTPVVPFDVAAATFLISLGLLWSFRNRLRSVRTVIPWGFTP